MSDTLKILLVEDLDSDAALVLNEFKKEGLSISHTRVQITEELLTALEDPSLDIVLCDYHLPRLSATSVLAILQTKRPELPCIIVSGSIGEEMAVEMIKGGAKDYVLKDRLQRLVPAVLREIGDAKNREKLRRTEQDLEKANLYVKRLKRFFSPKIADVVLSREINDPFTWHRSDVIVLFIDLRGFTGFSEVSEPEDVMKALHDYYKTIAEITHAFNGSVGHLAGDGIMIFFNDPVEIEDPQGTAVKMAIQARLALLDLCKDWVERDFVLNFGIGIASGYASIGGIGTEGFWDYAVIGTVTNLASRLCSEARNGQILASRRFIAGIEDRFETEPIGLVQRWNGRKSRSLWDGSNPAPLSLTKKIVSPSFPGSLPN